MISGVIAVRSRTAHVFEIERMVSRYVDNFTVYWDDYRRGQFWNMSRALTDLLPRAKPGEPVLFMTDDVTTVDDWHPRWEEIHEKAQSKIYCLFTRQRHKMKPENLARGYVTGLHLRGFYDQAVIFIDQHDLMDRINKWFILGRFLPRVRNRTKHLDVVIQEYLLYNNIPWTVTTPSLFDHKPIKSTLGHKVGGSPLYVGGMT